jgi:FkbM family methyltransferase
VLDEALPNRQEISAFLSLLASKKPQDDNARRAYGWALDLDPLNGKALNGLGCMHLARGEWEDARECFLRAFSADPNPVYLVNRANAETKLDRLDCALDLCDRAIESDAAFLPAYIQKTAIQQLMKLELLPTIEAGLALDPGCWELRFARAELRFAAGDVDEALEDYELRPSRQDLASKLDEMREWRGESLDGKTLLVCLEQGLGDQIQCARYLRSECFVRANVVVFTRIELARLLAPLGHRIITSNVEADPITFDYWVGIGSLAKYCPDISCDSYLTPDPDVVEYFQRLMPQDGKLRVGLSWAGNPEMAQDDERSMHFAQLAPLLTAPGITFFSLQHGAPAAQNDGATESRPEDLALRTHDLADLAGAIANLDLVITIDSAILHLAGALGKPVWGLMFARRSARWKSERPLYPSARLLVQGTPGDWEPVIEQVRLALTEAAQKHLLTAHGSSQKPAPPALLQTVHGRYGGMTFHPNDHYVGRSLRQYGEYSEAEAELLRAVLQPGDTVIEAGANIGALTVAIADMVRSPGQVLAFEPQDAYFDLLNWNAGRLCNVIVYREALGNAFTPIQLAGIELEAVHAPGWKHEARQATVQQLTIDSRGSCPALIKIDVDGQELEILEGAEATIERARPFLYVENDKPDVYPNLIPWIDAHGYRIYQHFAPLFNPRNFAGNPVNVFGKLVSAMLFCVPKERFMPEDFVRRFNLQRVRLRKEQ